MSNVVRKIGNSAGVVIPRPLLAALGAKAGDRVDMRVEDGRLVIERVAVPPRAGWADDARALAAAGDDGLAWPEFPNVEDDALTW